ncbi:uncharacterized protein LOC117118237, partial [Anneissia japonica]|uniref:uncharacterized protein LOC117118237 n=1 Tax=Anneissia japonica TaxID=1529436 RepID=UPI0014258BC8
MKKCMYGPRCKFAHDVYAEASNLRLLKRFNLEYPSDDLIRLIKERNEGYYRSDLEVFESDGKDSDSEESDEEQSCSSDTYETMAKSQTQSNGLLRFNNPQTMAMQDKKKEVYKDNPHFTTKHEPKVKVQTTLPFKHHVVTPQLPAKAQTPSNDLLDFKYFSQTVTMQGKKTEVHKDNPHITTKHEPVVMQTTSPSKCHVVMPQLSANSITQSNDLLDLCFSQTMIMQDKKNEVCKDNPLIKTKHEPKAVMQTTIPSKCHVVIDQRPANSQTQSNDFLELDLSETVTMQEKKNKVCKVNPNITTKHEAKATVQTTSTSKCHVVMPQLPAQSQTRSKHFNNPQTVKMQDKKEDHPLFPQPLAKTIQLRRFLDSSNPQTVALQSKKEEICKENLRGGCTSGSLCQRHHCDLPYQWQVKNNGLWESVNSLNNNDMEKDYCDMKVNPPVCLVFDTWGCMLIYYDDMYISNICSSLKMDIRRLEIKGEPDFFDSHFIPHWSWYWKDECGTWIEYAEQNSKQNARSDKESSDFETLYDDYKNRNCSQTVKFRAGSQHYTLNFASMIQTNDRYHTQKNVCRRPSRHITWADVKQYREEKPWLNKNKYPRTWNMNLRGKSHLLVSVSKNRHSEEYKKIQKLFQTTLSGVDITKLERVQNETCWDLYSRQKEVMMKKNPSKPVDERLLFHGTKPEKVEDICRDNFDFRLSGTRVGAVYGQGAYFASTSKYSDSYAEADGYNVKKMFVARVLVGSYTNGTRDMRRPPYKNSSDKTKGMYDSCVDNTSNPSIFVVFDNHQVYPEYVITYSTSNANHTSYSSTNQTSSYNPYTAAARYAYSASQTSDTSTSQRNSFNSYTSTTARRAYSASQTSYTGTSQRNSYTPST